MVWDVNPPPGGGSSREARKWNNEEPQRYVEIEVARSKGMGLIGKRPLKIV
jgi:hypothetical protein